ncbi:acetylserotonin O-methyltransferase [Actinomadura sp. ATCC 31491]|uniref:Acetylserotonin O-methyltransferase n=1 Tax=Actinomadura luzonensis TaxID=2805427 RepID=A0ABT0G2E0_9ACTN|nr:acetylserotonin O-methyltransferase [Actinomadura luzonensis]MCK2218780.1 acetylserotonin O-methyltransferase [Actinomadura luzonensis]
MDQGNVLSPEIASGALDEADAARLGRMAQVARDGGDGPYGLRFDHAGLLVFPRSAEAALAGLPVVRRLPSVIVKERLARRYGLAGPEVTIAHLDAGGGRTLELFLATGCPPEVAGDERLHERETHLAYEAPAASLGVLEALRADGCLPDGGGFNPGEGPSGRSVFYFRRRGGDRLEIVAAGQARAELARHLGAPEERRHMLGLLTGAWTTQALRTAAELGVADLLHARDRTLGELARATACPADRLGRLLRYLEQLGVVRRAGEAYALTPLGTTLARDSPSSLHGVALLYGGLFYRSFGELPGAVRGAAPSGFELAYGLAPFAHLDACPGDAAVFQLAMSDQCRDVFDAVADRLDLDGVGTVTDLGGGTGALLGRLLDAAPHVTGVLFDTPATVAAARPALVARHGGRVSAVGGDLFSRVPGGDLLVLSRVLHDWDDAACARILARCREATRPGGRLAVVERLLPERAGEPSLAAAWDVHMMVNNAGGRERTLEEYRELLAAAGFALTSRAGLPLDVHLLEAVAR